MDASDSREEQDRFFDRNSSEHTTARAELIGLIVWKHILATYNTLGHKNRCVFMLSEMLTDNLLGVARQYPNDNGVRIRLALNDGIDSKISNLEHKVHVTDKPAVYWRHYDKADIVVFAPLSKELDDVGAGLQPVHRIGFYEIASKVDDWAKVMLPFASSEYLKWGQNLLSGINDCRDICPDLNTFVDFVMATKELKDIPHQKKVGEAAWALRLPRNCFSRLPDAKFENGSAYSAAVFAKILNNASVECGNYPYLKKRDESRLDLDPVIKTLDVVTEKATQSNPEDTEALIAIAITRMLLDDVREIRSGVWRHSQEQFCQHVDWQRYGNRFFKVGKRSNSGGLWKSTLKLIEEEYPDELTEELRNQLEDLNSQPLGEATIDSKNFYTEWQERIFTSGKRSLFERWRKYIFEDQVNGHDFLPTLVRGFEALLSKASLDEQSDETGDMEGDAKFRIEVKTRNSEKHSSWTRIDSEVYSLFRFEVQLLSNIFGPTVCFDLGVCFNPDCINEAKPSTRKDDRQIEMEMFLYHGRTSQGNSSVATTVDEVSSVRVIWSPYSGKKRSIALSFVSDLEALASSVKDGKQIRVPQGAFTLKAVGNIGKRSLIALNDTESFIDVMKGDKGRLIDTSQLDDTFNDLMTCLKNLYEDRVIAISTFQEIKTRLLKFQKFYGRAIYSVIFCPKKAFASNIIMKQATAFGALCDSVRILAGESNEVRSRLFPLICGFALIPSSRSNASGKVIIPAWHPLRLAEKCSKAKYVRDLIAKLLMQRNPAEGELGVLFEKHHKALDNWYYPEILQHNRELFVAVQHDSGYSLAIPASDFTDDKEGLETTTLDAVGHFINAANEYLVTNPHEETSLSLVVYNSESASLPVTLVKEFEQRLASNSSLRCELLITHENEERRREIYSEQNTRLTSEGIGESARGFLSQLRVGVEKQIFDVSEDEPRPYDLVFLHESFSQCSQIDWKWQDGDAGKLWKEFSPRETIKPRRFPGTKNSKQTEILLSTERPPRSVAQFLNLVFCSEGIMRYVKPGKHALPLLKVEYSNDQVQQIIKRAHNLGEWVVTYDRLANRRLLRTSNIKIIRDIALPGLDTQVLISSESPGSGLQSLLVDEILDLGNIKSKTDAEHITEQVIEAVIEFAGQKIMATTRSRNSARELLGLAVCRYILSIGTGQSTKLVFLSLDDNKGLLGIKGEVADILALAVAEKDDSFEICLCVAEAKYTTTTSASSAKTKSLNQLKNTYGYLSKIFSVESELQREAWCTRLLEALTVRPEFAEAFGSDPRKEERFRSRLIEGKVSFHITGESVVCIYDHSEFDLYEQYLPLPDEFPDLRQSILGKSMIEKALKSFSECTHTDLPGLKETRDRLPETGLKKKKVETGNSDTTIVTRHSEKVKEPPTLTPVSKRQVQTGHPNIGFKPRFWEALHAVASTTKSKLDSLSERVWVERTSSETQRALTELGMHARFLEQPAIATPNGVLINFKGHLSLTEHRLNSVLSQLRTTYAIRAVDVIPGLGSISLFVERNERKLVNLAETWIDANWPVNEAGRVSIYLIGRREDNGELLYLNFGAKVDGIKGHGTHTLIAGETGSGKGVLLQNLLLQMIALNDPNSLEIWLIDPKHGVDFPWIRNAPHLSRGIIVDQDGAIDALKATVDEMEHRYTLLAKQEVPNIHEYNCKVSPECRLPKIFLIHDEMGDWMAGSEEYRKTVQDHAVRLGMKARAAGIHLILVTQRASRESIPVLLRDNMNNRISMKVSNEAGSKLVLGSSGGERLLGNGHALAKLKNETPEHGDYFRVQVPFVSTENLNLLAQVAIQDMTRTRSVM